MKDLSYEEFKELWKEPKYFNQPCFMPGCKNLAEYEGGDARFYCGVCEQHSRIKERYDKSINKTIPYIAPNPHIDCSKYNF